MKKQGIHVFYIRRLGSLIEKLQERKLHNPAQTSKAAGIILIGALVQRCQPGFYLKNNSLKCFHSIKPTRTKLGTIKTHCGYYPQAPRY